MYIYLANKLFLSLSLSLSLSSEDTERVQCDIQQYADMAEAAKARLPIVAWQKHGMTGQVRCRRRS